MGWQRLAAVQLLCLHVHGPAWPVNGCVRTCIFVFIGRMSLWPAGMAGEELAGYDGVVAIGGDGWVFMAPPLPPLLLLHAVDCRAWVSLHSCMAKRGD